MLDSKFSLKSCGITEMDLPDADKYALTQWLIPINRVCAGKFADMIIDKSEVLSLRVVGLCSKALCVTSKDAEILSNLAGKLNSCIDRLSDFILEIKEKNNLDGLRYFEARELLKCKEYSDFLVPCYP